MTNHVCSNCSAPLDPDDSGWPDEGDGVLCQECWEDYASRLWWKMVQNLGEVLGRTHV